MTANETTNLQFSNLLMKYYDEDSPDSLNQFFLYSLDFVFRSSYYYLGHASLAEEAVKQTFYHILKRSSICPSSALQDDEKIKSWLIGILLNVSKEVSKKGKKKPLEAIHQRNISHKVNLKQTLILEEVLQLPEKQKLPLMLHYRERISILELSHIFQLSQTQIKSNIQAALDQLKVLLKNSGMILTGDLICREIQIIKLPEYSKDLQSQIRIENLSKLNVALELKKSNGQPFMQWLIIMAFAIPLLLTFLYLMEEKYSSPPPETQSPKKETPQKVILQPKDENKTAWNFAIDTESGFTVLKGNWTHDPVNGIMKTNFNTTSLIQTPFVFTPNSQPTLIKVDCFIFNPFIDREISSRINAYLVSGKKTTKYKFISHVTKINKTKTKFLGGAAIDNPVKIVVHQKGIFVLDKENKLISSMLFTEPLPLTSKIVLGIDNIYTKSISIEQNAILPLDIESKINESSLDTMAPGEEVKNQK